MPDVREESYFALPSSRLGTVAAPPGSGRHQDNAARDKQGGNPAATPHALV